MYKLQIKRSKNGRKLWTNVAEMASVQNSNGISIGMISQDSKSNVVILRDDLFQIDIDFEAAFSRSDCLLSHCKECFQSIVDLLKVPGNLKEKTTKSLLDKIEDESYTESKYLFYYIFRVFCYFEQHNTFSILYYEISSIF